MPTIIPMPADLHKLATRAEHERDHVHLSPDEARALANAWHDDHEKVRYLETLIVRMARGGDGPALLTLPPLDANQRKYLAAMLLRFNGLASPDGTDAPT